jgi:hypothetical protein
MERRELLKMIAVLTGGAVIGGNLLLSGCKSNAGKTLAFSVSDIALLDEIGDTIIPTTPDSPGAKAAKIGNFMKTIVNDCYTQKEQDAFGEGLNSFDDACKKAMGKSFVELDEAKRKAFLISLEKEAKTFNTAKEEKQKPIYEKWKAANEKLPFSEQKEFEEAPSHYYTMMKQLTLWGYFTSEIGATKALRNVPVPGRYDGNVPYKKGEKAYA